MTGHELTERIRYRIVGLLHVGRLSAGDRLPSIRETARTTGADHRAVAAAYRELEEEGLVEIRPGSGVYVAGPGHLGGGILSSTRGWIAEVLAEAWRRRLSRAELGALLAPCLTGRLRCALVESAEDPIVAISAELEEDFGLVVEPVVVRERETVADLADRVAGADLVVATIFHEELGRSAARETGKPFVLVTTNPEFVAEVDRILSAGPAVGVVADARTRDRMLAYFRVTAHAERVRAVLADEVGSLAELEEPGVTVLATRAARRHLREEEFHIIPAPPTLLSPETAAALHREIVRACTENVRTGTPGPA